jgi:hypothetical protein
MDLLTKKDLEKLIETKDQVCVSIYLPTIQAGQERKQNFIRFKNLLQKAKEQLPDFGLTNEHVFEFLKPGFDYWDKTDQWDYPSKGLACFITKDQFLTYRLPLEFEEIAVVSKNFHLRPLLPLFARNGKYFVLALNQKGAKLYHATAQSIEEIKLPENIPTSMEEVLKYDEKERHVEQHSGVGPQQRRPGMKQTMFHGQNVGKDEHKKDLKRFAEAVDKAVMEKLNEEKAPLVLVGISELVGVYREANKYKYLVEEFVDKNPADMKESKIHKKAMKVDRYQQLAGTGDTSNKVEKIVPGAYNSKIETLFVVEDAHEWGCYNPKVNEVQIHPERDKKPEDRDLLDAAAIETYLHGGKVYQIPSKKMPDTTAMAAIYRY